MQTDVREALADEREKFEAWPFFAKMNDAAREYAWRAWQARAALAAPSQAEPVDAADLAQLNGALVRSRDGYISEAATGLPVLAQWRSETLDWLDAGLATVARLKAASPKPAHRGCERPFGSRRRRRHQSSPSPRP